MSVDDTLPADDAEPPDEAAALRATDLGHEETLPGPDGAGPGRASATPQRAERFGRFVVLGQLGRGGMGVVLEAFDPQLDRRVALKVLRQNLGARQSARLLREARAMAKLSHPNVVQVYEVGQVEAQTFIAMELVEGQTVERWVTADPAPNWRACTRVFVQLADGLTAAHEQGLVHRDFKPSNAIVDARGRARVLDFGLVRRHDEHPEQSDPADKGGEVLAHDEDPLTRTGAVLGTPAYMSPEQISGREADANSDQFSLCVSLYEALYGERPFGGDTPMAAMAATTEGKVLPAPRGTKVPPALRKVVVRGLSLEPDARWPTMDALASQLRAIADPRPARGRWLVGLSMGLVAVGGGLAAAQYAAVKDRCTGARAQLKGIWDDARRRAVEGAILGSGASHAPGTWARVERHLDDYTGRWASKHTEICEATRVTRTQTDNAMDLRMACLGRRRNTLGAAVEALAQADAEVADRAVSIVAGLPGVDRCDDVERLALQRQRVPPPEDPQVVERVEVLRERLARLEFAHDAHGWAEQEVDAILEEADALGYAPLRAEAMYQRGWNLLNRRDHGSRPQLVEAYVLAAELGHDALAMRAAQALAPMPREEGLWWGRMVAVPLARRRGDPVELATSLSSLGRVLATLRRFDEATQLHREALELRVNALGPDHPAVSNSLNNLAYLSLDQERFEQAQGYFERSLEIRREAFGAEHHMVAHIFTALGEVATRRGSPERAREHYARALEIWTAAKGTDHPQTAWSMTDLGRTLLGLQHFDEAEPLLQQARQHNERLLEPGHPKIAESLVSLAQLWVARGDWARARSYAEQVLTFEQDTVTAKRALAEARFVIARALAEDPEQRVRARQMATEAAEALAALGGHGAGARARVEAWLAKSSAPSSP